MPTTYTLLQLSEQVYFTNSESLGNWKRNDYKSDEETGLGYAIYHNKHTNETVIAFRGTDQAKLQIFISNLWTVGLIMLGQAPNTTAAAQNIVAVVRKKRSIWDKFTDFAQSGNSNQLYFTGHSLGGLLAEIVGAYYITQHNKNYKVVSFESPGFGSFIDLPAIKDSENLKKKIIAYVNSPNLINTRGHHMGTLMHLQNPTYTWIDHLMHGIQCMKNDGLILLILLGFLRYVAEPQSLLDNGILILFSLLSAIFLPNNQQNATVDLFILLSAVFSLKVLERFCHMYQQKKEHSIEALKKCFNTQTGEPKHAVKISLWPSSKQYALGQLFTFFTDFVPWSTARPGIRTLCFPPPVVEQNRLAYIPGYRPSVHNG